jgi:hypothetical protein
MLQEQEYNKRALQASAIVRDRATENIGFGLSEEEKETLSSLRSKILQDPRPSQKDVIQFMESQNKELRIKEPSEEEVTNFMTRYRFEDFVKAKATRNLVLLRRTQIATTIGNMSFQATEVGMNQGFTGNTIVLQKPNQQIPQ